QRLRAELRMVVEAVDDAARYAEGLAGLNVDLPVRHGPGQDAIESIDRLLVAVVAVRDGDVRAGRNLELEDRDRTTGCRALEDEPNGQRPDRDLFTCCGRRRHAPFSKC